MVRVVEAAGAPFRAARTARETPLAVLGLAALRFCRSRAVGVPVGPLMRVSDWTGVWTRRAVPRCLLLAARSLGNSR